MIAGMVHFVMALTLLASSYGVSCKSGEHSTSIKKDSTVLAGSESPFAINSKMPYYQVQLKSTGEKRTGNKAFLVIDRPQISGKHEGVYELYLTTGPIGIVNLISSNHGFVNLLDLYPLMSDDTLPQLILNITDKLNELSEPGKSIPPLYITILFRGNKLSDGPELKLAGELKVKAIKIVQTN